MESYEVVRVAHAALLSQGCEPVGREGSVGRPVARILCGSCFTCGSRLEEMPARAKTLNPAPCIHHHVVTSPRLQLCATEHRIPGSEYPLLP